AVAMLYGSAEHFDGEDVRDRPRASRVKRNARAGLRVMGTSCWRMIFSENRYPPRIKCGAGFFGIMPKGVRHAFHDPAHRPHPASGGRSLRAPALGASSWTSLARGFPAAPSPSRLKSATARPQRSRTPVLACLQ